MEIERELVSWPQWIELPEDIMGNILERVDVVERLESVEKVCTTWKRICSYPVMWRDLLIDISDAENWNKKKLWRRAVDRSQGQMTHLSIIKFCDNNLLNYAVNRSSGLKTLALLKVEGFTGKDLVEAVKKLPHLEHLDLVLMPQVNAQDVINIGISCPNLKSFTYNPYPISIFCFGFMGFPCIERSPINVYALAIAENMPNLCHLRLNSKPIDNKGLEAILDGCPNLESLNLFNCNGLDLRGLGALGKRCSEQIKQLILPCSHIIQSIEDEDDDVPDQFFDANI